MAKRSSTSNSEALPKAGGLPWATAGAVAIVLAVEVIFRLAPPTRVIPYRNGIEERYAITNYLSAVGAADVAFVGSSATRTGILAPRVRARLEEVLGRPVYVANYGASGVMADEAAAITRYMARKRALPKLMAVEVTPRSFSVPGPTWLNERSAFWDLREWREAIPRYGPTTLDALPNVIRNEIGERYLTFRYRKKIRFLAHEWLLGIRQSPAPMNGQVAQGRGREVSIANVDRKERLLAAWREVRLKDGTFPLDRRQAKDFDDLLNLCQERCIPVILYDAPYSDAVVECTPRETYRQFYATVQELAEKHGAVFLKRSDMQLELSDLDFSEVCHLNRRGAEKLSRAITEKALVPAIGVLR